MILPCLGRTEEDIQKIGKQFLTIEDSMGIINPSEGFFPPASPELMSDVAIVANLAQATLGSRTTTNWLCFAADYDLIRDAISRVIPGFENFNARLAEEKFSICRTQQGSAPSKRAPVRRS
jgi:hypothetical protein